MKTEVEFQSDFELSIAQSFITLRRAREESAFPSSLAAQAMNACDTANKYVKTGHWM